MDQSLSSSQTDGCQTQTPWYRKPLWLVVAVITLLGVVLLVSGQIGYVGQLWPYLFVLACPLVMLFMCRGQK